MPIQQFNQDHTIEHLYKLLIAFQQYAALRTNHHLAYVIVKDCLDDFTLNRCYIRVMQADCADNASRLGRDLNKTLIVVLITLASIT